MPAMTGPYGKYHSLRSLFLGFLGAIPVAGFVNFYCLGHLWLKIPLQALIEPFVVFCALLVLLVPCVYWSMKYDALLGGSHRRLLFVVTSWMFIGGELVVYYGARMGRLPAEEARSLYAMGLIVTPACGFLAFQFHKRISRE